MSPQWREYTAYYLSIVKRLTAVFILMVLTRILFLAFNAEHFDDLSFGACTRIFFGGLWFDSSQLCYINFAYIVLVTLPLRARCDLWFQRTADSVFVLSNTLALAANSMDFAYYPFAMKRTTAEFFAEFSGHDKFLSLAAGQIVEFWPATLAFVFLTATLVAIVKYLPVKGERQVLSSPTFHGTSTAAMAICVLLLIVGCRGGFFSESHRPITNNDARRYVDNPEHAALVLNTPFSIIRTIDKEVLEARDDFSADVLPQVYTPVHPATAARTFRPVNVVLIILESFGPNAIGALNPDLAGDPTTGYTPYFDSLVNSCANFPYAVANGVRSVESLAPLLAAIPNLRQRFVLSHYYSNKFDGLGTILKTRGYHTAFFHGAPSGSMGFDAFARSAGFGDVYDMERYGNDADSDGAWGIWDEEFFQYTANRLDEIAPPFAAALFSLSSHSPFVVPDKYEGHFKQGRSRAHEVMGYTDFALKRFFQSASTKAWFDNTLFVLTADHSAVRRHDNYKNSYGLFRVPLLFCRASDPALTGRFERTAQHADILPTVLGYLGYDEPFLAFGKDLFDPTSEDFAITYIPQGGYQLFRGPYVLHSDGHSPSALFNYRNDVRLYTNLLPQKPEVADVMTTLLKGIIQQYNNRMRENRLALAR